MKYDSIILAGGENSSELKKIAPHDNEALIIIGKNPMIHYVYSAVKKVSKIDKIIISGPDTLKNLFTRDDRLLFCNGGDNVINSLANAVSLLKSQEISSKILVMPTDIPFITNEAISDFIIRCEAEEEADFYYSITRKEDNEKKYPGVERTYVGLKEGVFTGGNLFMLNSEVVEQSLEMGFKIMKRRKNPLAIARLFGFRFVLKLIFRQLSIFEAEKRFTEVMGIKGKAIISPYAEVGVDVDKVADLELAQKYLAIWED